MGWYRTRSGRLIHGEGGLAAVYEARGWTAVADEDAAVEVASGAAQARADIEGELARAVDDQDEKTHPGFGEPSEGIEVPADGTMRELTVDGDEPDDSPGEVLLDNEEVGDQGGMGLLSTLRGRRKLTPEEQADVDAAVRDEAYGG